MTEFERKVILTVAGGCPENFQHLHHIHTRFKRGFQMLCFLVQSGITGPSFTQLIKDCEGSYGVVANTILKRMEGVKKRPLLITDLQ